MTQRILISSRKLLGAVAKWGTEQSPYPRPDNLELVLDKLYELTKEDFDKGELGFVEFADDRELVKFVNLNLRKIPEYLAWNERKNGNQAPFNFTSRYDAGKKQDPDNDFIDLDALERNVAHELIKESII
uniref:Uncharacterized protein n=1 Tax=viral metagenome TaxID=1070528 RepID=A0A6M3KS56_9ZZZZ